jgi:hypothetical protein
MSQFSYVFHGQKRLLSHEIWDNVQFQFAESSSEEHIEKKGRVPAEGFLGDLAFQMQSLCNLSPQSHSILLGDCISYNLCFPKKKECDCFPNQLEGLDHQNT